MNAEVIKLADRLDKALEEGLDGVGVTGLPNEESLERHIGMFRRFVSHFGAKAAEARQACKTELKILAAARRVEMERHRQAIAELDERVSEAAARGAEEEAAAQRLAASYSEALATAEGRL